MTKFGEQLTFYQSGCKVKSHHSGMLLSIDLHNVFDSISRTYMFEILQRWGFRVHLLLTFITLFSCPIVHREIY